MNDFRQGAQSVGKLGTALGGSPGAVDDNVAAEFGERVDGCSELVEGIGSQVAEFRESFTSIVTTKKMPVVTSWTMIGPGKALEHFVDAIAAPYREVRRPAEAPQDRPYFVLETEAGAVVGVYIGKFGQDLYVSWGLHMRLPPNWALLGPVLVLSVIWAFLNRPFWLTMSPFAEPHLTFGAWLWSFVTCNLVVGFVLVVAGILLKRNPMGYILRQWTAFDMDDAIAMSLAAHRSLLQTADALGIDLPLLRMKQQFGSGQRSRLI